MRIGIDIDGVLADFNRDYINRCLQVTGRDLFPPRPFEITTWNYPESFGYSAQEVSAVWESIKTDPLFWYGLEAYPDAGESITQLAYLERVEGYEVYFITARPGVRVKQQTESWLKGLCAMPQYCPTVLISSHKGICAKALDLDAYIDDKDLNVYDVVQNTDARTFVMDRPWNRNIKHERYESGEYITRVSSVQQMLALLTP
jgi:5'(3')-deoxyribonucleotidase